LHHINVKKTEVIGRVTDGLFATAQTIGTMLRNVQVCYGLQAVAWSMFKAEAKASNFQLLTFKKDLYEDIFQPQGFTRRCRPAVTFGSTGSDHQQG
jgi:hypothetical protein